MPFKNSKLTRLRKSLFLDKYVLKTKLSPQQICDIVGNNTDTLDYFRINIFSENTKEYEAEVSANSFEIRKIGSFRTSLLVSAKGTIEEQNSGTQIKIKVRPSLSAILFHSVWFGFVTTVSIIVLWIGLTRDLKALLFLFVPVIMLLFASRNISFRRESEELRNFLTELLDN
jgi:hypothetical protein